MTVRVRPSVQVRAHIHGPIRKDRRTVQPGFHVELEGPAAIPCGGDKAT